MDECHNALENQAWLQRGTGFSGKYVWHSGIRGCSISLAAMIRVLEGRAGKGNAMSVTIKNA